MGVDTLLAGCVAWLVLGSGASATLNRVSQSLDQSDCADACAASGWFLPCVASLGEDAALLYDVVATAELDAARTPPSTDAEECDDDDAALLMALKAAPCAS